jgi:hypothetical protein
MKDVNLDNVAAKIDTVVDAGKDIVKEAKDVVSAAT